MSPLDTVFSAVGNIGLLVATFLALTFVVLYQVLAKWEKSQFGIQNMISAVSLTLVLGLGVWALIARHDYPGKLIIRAIIILGLCLLLIWRIFLLIREQKRARVMLNHPSNPASRQSVPLADTRKKNSMVLGNPLLSWIWWRAALIRGVRTAVLLAIPYVPASYTGAVPYLTISSSAALGFILSLLTSLVSLPEANGKAQPWWYAVFNRVVRTVAQSVVAGIGSAVLIQDVHWLLILQTAGTAAFGSILLSVLSELPETITPTVIGGSISGPLAPNAGALAPNAGPLSPAQPVVQVVSPTAAPATTAVGGGVSQ